MTNSKMQKYNPSLCESTRVFSNHSSLAASGGAALASSTLALLLERRQSASGTLTVRQSAVTRTQKDMLNSSLQIHDDFED